MLTVEVRRVPNRTCAQVIRPNRLFVFVGTTHVRAVRAPEHVSWEHVSWWHVS